MNISKHTLTEFALATLVCSGLLSLVTMAEAGITEGVPNTYSTLASWSLAIFCVTFYGLLLALFSSRIRSVIDVMVGGSVIFAVCFLWYRYMSMFNNVTFPPFEGFAGLIATITVALFVYRFLEWMRGRRQKT